MRQQPDARIPPVTQNTVTTHPPERNRGGRRGDTEPGRRYDRALRFAHRDLTINTPLCYSDRVATYAPLGNVNDPGFQAPPRRGLILNRH